MSLPELLARMAAAVEGLGDRANAFPDGCQRLGHHVADLLTFSGAVERPSSDLHVQSHATNGARRATRVWKPAVVLDRVFLGVDVRQFPEELELLLAAERIVQPVGTPSRRKVVHEQDEDVAFPCPAMETRDLFDVLTTDDRVEREACRIVAREAGLDQDIDRLISELCVVLRTWALSIGRSGDDGVLVRLVPETVDLHDDRRSDFVQSLRERLVRQTERGFGVHDRNDRVTLHPLDERPEIRVDGGLACADEVDRLRSERGNLIDERKPLFETHLARETALFALGISGLLGEAETAVPRAVVGAELDGRIEHAMCVDRGGQFFTREVPAMHRVALAGLDDVELRRELGCLDARRLIVHAQTPPVWG